MGDYKDIRIFSFDNGGMHSQTVLDEYEKRFNGPSSIILPFNIYGDYNAFVVYNEIMVKYISSIYNINTQIEKELKNVPREAYKEYIISSLIEEIQQSNEFENVESTRQEIKNAYDNLDKNITKRFYGMVNKYNILLSGSKIDLFSSSDVRTLYNDFVLNEVVEENPLDYPDGEIFRKEMVHIYGRGQDSIHDGLYPETKIIESMDQALHVLNDDEKDVLIRVAIFHFMFGYIHPFYNGNGRMSRFISSYMLSQVLNLAVCLRISYIIKENRSKYHKMFKDAEDKRNMGELTSFVNDFLELIFQACVDVKDDIHEKTELYQIMKFKLDKVLEDNKDIASKYNKVFYFILEKSIFIGNGATIEDIAKYSGFSRITINSLLEKGTSFLHKRKDGRTNYWLIRFKD